MIRPLFAQEFPIFTADEYLPPEGADRLQQQRLEDMATTLSRRGWPVSKAAAGSPFSPVRIPRVCVVMPA